MKSSNSFAVAFGGLAMFLLSCGLAAKEDTSLDGASPIMLDEARLTPLDDTALESAMPLLDENGNELVVVPPEIAKEIRAKQRNSPLDDPKMQSLLAKLSAPVTAQVSRVTPFDTFVTSVHAMSGGSTGYPFFIVVNVDPSKIWSYQVKSTDPYWLQYYMKMFKSGNHARVYGPKPLPNPYTVLFMRQCFSSNGSYLNNCGINQSAGYEWEFIAQKLWNGSGIYYMPDFFPSYFQGASGDRYTAGEPIAPCPTCPPDGMSYFRWVPSNGFVAPVYLGYGFRIYTRENQASLGAATTVQRVVLPGEVENNGWALLPLNGKEQDLNVAGNFVRYLSAPWVIVKPYNKPLNFNQNVAGQAYFSIPTVNTTTMKKIEWQGAVATTQNAAWAGMMNDYMNHSLAGLNNAKFGANLDSTSFAGLQGTRTDKQMANTFTLVHGQLNTNGTITITAREVPALEAVTVGRANPNIYQNGSGNSYSDALNAAGVWSAFGGGKGVVVHFHPQSFNYLGASITSPRDHLTSYVNTLTSNGTLVNITGFSWGNQIIQGLNTNPRVTLNYVGPATGIFGIGFTAFNAGLSGTARSNLFVGNYDMVSAFGAPGSYSACGESATCTPNSFTGGHNFIDSIVSGGIRPPLR